MNMPEIKFSVRSHQLNNDEDFISISDGCVIQFESLSENKVYIIYPGTSIRRYITALKIGNVLVFDNRSKEEKPQKLIYCNLENILVAGYTKLVNRRHSHMICVAIDRTRPYTIIAKDISISISEKIAESFGLEFVIVDKFIM